MLDMMIGSERAEGTLRFGSGGGGARGKVRKGAR
jgi:hypothetical protein